MGVNIIQPVPRSGARYTEKMQLMTITEKMTRYGWRVSSERLCAHRETALAKIEHFNEIFSSATGLPRSALGPAGSGQTAVVKDYFYNDLSAPPTVIDKKTKRPSFNTAQLIEWAGSGDMPYALPAAALYALRKNKKLTEFCATYAKFSKSSGRVHFQFNPIGTQTGRWTSSTAYGKRNP